MSGGDLSPLALIRRWVFCNNSVWPCGVLRTVAGLALEVGLPKAGELPHQNGARGFALLDCRSETLCFPELLSPKFLGKDPKDLVDRSLTAALFS